MINPRFEKKAFKKEVEQNVKQLFRKTVDEVSQQELYQSQFLSCIVVIVRVQDLYDRFCQILLLYRFVIVTTVK